MSKLLTDSLRWMCCKCLFMLFLTSVHSTIKMFKWYQYQTPHRKKNKKTLDLIRYFALESLLLRYSNNAEKFRPVVHLKKKNFTAVAAYVLNCSFGIYKTCRTVTFRYDHRTKNFYFYLPKLLHLQLCQYL